MRPLLTGLARAALFPGLVLTVLALTQWIQVPGVARYDVIFVVLLAIQIGLVVFKVETPREAATIFLFHALGVTLEGVKVNLHGGWSYPDPAVLKVWNIPLFSGFMYASIGSFLLGAAKQWQVRTEGFPKLPIAIAFTAAVYGNFIANVWLPDAKWPLVVIALVLFRKTALVGQIGARAFRVPYLGVFPILGVLLWLAENLGTAVGTWQYPRQAEGWTWVPPDKLLSWAVLTLVSGTLVVLLRDRAHVSAPQ